MVEQRTRDYELMMIISPEANEVEIDAASARVAGFIADRGGLVYDQDNWGLRRLAYPIQKFHEGNYVLTRFALEPSEVIELDNSLKASDDVMRHLTMKIDKSVKIEPPEPEPEVEEEPEEPAAETPADQPEAQAEDATVAQAPEAPVAQAEAEEETPDAPVAQAETAEPAAQAETEAPAAQSAPVAEAEAPAEPVAEAPAEPAAEEEPARPEGESP